MNIHRSAYGYQVTIITLTLCFIVGAVVEASAHGGKTHADNPFTTLQALQEATTLFDRLITNNKLEESWETGLQGVNISKRIKNEREELVVSFKRQSGNPDTVYIFFSSEGKYAGSNFTGE